MMEDFKAIIENTDRKPVFVDLNNILYRSYYVFSPDRFKSHQGLPNGHLFGLCQNLRTMDKLDYEIFLCEDSPCDWRKSLNEDYKSNRNPSEGGTEFWRDYPKIRNLISDLAHAHSLAAENYEADDIMYTAAKLCSNMNRDCYIFSADKDLLQALDNHITIVHKITLSGNEEITYDSEAYNEKFPVTPNKLPIYRAFKGDASDNLSTPVKRLPKDLILDLVDYLYDNGSLKDYKLKKKSHEKWLKQLVDNWQVFLNNYKVMRLNPIEFKVLDKSPLDSFIKVCQDYDLYQFLKYMRN